MSKYHTRTVSIGLLTTAIAASSLTAQTKRLPLPGEVFTVAGHTAFLIEPPADARAKGPLPWVWYAPTLPRLPGKAEKWMFERFLAAGIAIAGIDVGESYGSPDGSALYQAFYKELTQKRGYKKRPVLLARSRGGLMLYNWAAEHPESVAGIAGIYPVCNIASYPGVKRAAAAYELTAAKLEARLTEFNPIDRLAGLAKAKVPILHLQGDNDKTVPLEANSGELQKRYRVLGGPIEVAVIPKQGHNMWVGWFQSQKLTDFIIEHARFGPSGAKKPEPTKNARKRPARKKPAPSSSSK